MKSTLLAAILCAATVCCVPTYAQTDSTFTYQGELKSSGQPANGMFEMEFTLRVTSDSSLVAGPMTMVVDVGDGIFTADLDFGDDMFVGEGRSLQIRVRPDGDPGGFTELLPWIEIHSAPTSQYSLQTRGIYVSPTGSVGVGTTNTGDAKLVVDPAGVSLAAIFNGDVRIGDADTGTTGTLLIQGSSGAPAIQASTSWYAIRGTHSTTTGTFPGLWGDTNSRSSNANGVRGYVNSSSPGAGSAGVRGYNNGTNSNGYGVWGSHAGGGAGIYGTSANGPAGFFDGDIRVNGEVLRDYGGGQYRPAGPIAYGVINADGSIASSTSNIDYSFYGAGVSSYFIEIVGVDYNPDDFTTIVTPVGTASVYLGQTWENGTNLQVSLRNQNSAYVQGKFAFVVYRNTP